MRRFDVLSQKEVLKALRIGLYSVDQATGEVRNQKGRIITPFPGGKDGNRWFVYLYWNGRRRAIAVPRLVWMSVTKRVIPHGFEIHHRDENKRSNDWSNLFCLFELDHKKLHGSDLLASNQIGQESEEVPF